MNVDSFFEQYPNVIKNMTMQDGRKVIEFFISINDIIPEDNVPKNMKIDQVNVTQEAYHLRVITADYSFEEICDFIDNIIKFNEELEKKRQLFKEKHSELEQLFSDYSLEELKNLEFNISKSSENENNENQDFFQDADNVIDNYVSNGKQETKDTLK